MRCKYNGIKTKIINPASEILFRIFEAGFFVKTGRKLGGFGKSLLVSTFQSYFEGKKELFKGLAIEILDKEWNSYPVLHFSLAGGKHMEKDAMEQCLYVSCSLSCWQLEE